MAPWVAVVEGVRRVHKGVHRLRHGPLEGDEGGTNIESPAEQGPGFGSHLWEEIQTQAGLRKNEADPLQKPDPLHKSDPLHTSQHKPNEPAKERKRWPLSCRIHKLICTAQQPKESFINHFLNELLTQTKGGDKK
ncbi:hypothetical protein D6D18_06101 [Aureobasidium pullulans]|uniref:Uncharacterized protein n=1 Tax=Aureobasidium pullulans TaxID=5580 RepID=A0A4S9ELT3_AURPU|nr:hypothetical protein D6D18_06101 [Aureobasidium pullulans]THX27725.1 hypothetical protein D6D12_05340 [Aureobasidium pullulans]THX34613.1 hypothetical protein D6D11_09664 [Aureobasidium pullulans]